MKLSVRSTFSKKDLRKPVMKEYWSSTIWFRNVVCANWSNWCIGDRTTEYLCRKWSRIITLTNLIWSFLILHMKLYCV